jgi:hypothetical protein
MGVYINPTNGQSKEGWLASFCESVIPYASISYSELRSKGLVPVCLVDNVIFSAAAVCFSEQETREFGMEDGRKKYWYLVPLKSLKESAGISEKELETHGLQI